MADTSVAVMGIGQDPEGQGFYSSFEFPADHLTRDPFRYLGLVAEPMVMQLEDFGVDPRSIRWSFNVPVFPSWEAA